MGIGTKVSGTNLQDRGPADKLHDPRYRGNAQLDLENSITLLYSTQVTI